jgi:hypothetical protein
MVTLIPAPPSIATADHPGLIAASGVSQSLGGVYDFVNKVALSNLADEGAVQYDVMTFNGSQWVPGVGNQVLAVTQIITTSSDQISRPDVPFFSLYAQLDAGSIDLDNGFVAPTLQLASHEGYRCRIGVRASGNSTLTLHNDSPSLWTNLRVKNSSGDAFADSTTIQAGNYIDFECGFAESATAYWYETNRSWAFPQASSGSVSHGLSNDNRGMYASNTSNDGDLACSVSLTTTPIGWIDVHVNGLMTECGDGVKTKACYFSADGGTTAKSNGNLAAGDMLYWNGTIALFQLKTNFVIDFVYDV